MLLLCMYAPRSEINQTNESVGPGRVLLGPIRPNVRQEAHGQAAAAALTGPQGGCGAARNSVDGEYL